MILFGVGLILVGALISVAVDVGYVMCAMGLVVVVLGASFYKTPDK